MIKMERHRLVMTVNATPSAECWCYCNLCDEWWRWRYNWTTSVAGGRGGTGEDGGRGGNGTDGTDGGPGAWSNLLTSTALPMSTESVSVAVHKFGTVETSILPILLLTAMMLTPVSPRSAARELREIQGNLVTLEREEIQGWLDIKDRMGKRVKMDKMQDA